MPARDTKARDHVGSLMPSQTSDDETELSTLDNSETEEEEQAAEKVAPLSRKEKRKLKKLQSQPADSVASDATNDKNLKTPPNNPPKTQKPATTDSTVPRSIKAPMPPSNYYPLLVCSIGNPGAQYAKTLHSAGHYILQTIHNGSGNRYQSFQKGLSGLVARPSTTQRTFGIFGMTKHTGQEVQPEQQDNFTLWQSTTLMNVSGKAVKSAWTAFSSEQRQRGLEPRLVIVHDELESTVGKVTVKDGSASARGHNGLKSIQAAFGGNLKWRRIGVGIGRPESRDAAVVSQYVLRKMTYKEEKVLYDASTTVLKRLQDIADGTL